MIRKYAVYVMLALTVFLCQGHTVYASVDSAYEVAVINMSGDVQVDSKADGTWVKPWIGMKLMKLSVIKTDAASSIDVVFDSEGLNVLRIKENTLVTVQAARVDLEKGAVMASFANMAPGSTFSVKTPTAVCGIRGSGMGVDFIGNMTVVSAYEHSVYVQGIDGDGNPVGQEVVIPEGWKIQVLDNGDTTPPEGLTENELAIFNAWVAFVTGDVSLGDDEGDEDDTDNKDFEDLKNEEKEDISPSGDYSSGVGDYSFGL